MPNADRQRRPPGRRRLVRAMASTFALTITNPATLLGFTAMFSSLSGLMGPIGRLLIRCWWWRAWPVVRRSWWLTLATLIGRLHHSISDNTMRHINQISGVVIGLFGLARAGPCPDWISSSVFAAAEGRDPPAALTLARSALNRCYRVSRPCKRQIGHAISRRTRLPVQHA